MIHEMQERRDTAPVCVLGAGMAGLTAANDLHQRGYPVRVFEASDAIAGMGQTFQDGGVRYDFGAHLITSRLGAALGVSANCHTVTEWRETVLLKGRIYGFPSGLLTSPGIVLSALAAKARFWRAGTIRSAADWYRINCGKKLAEEIAIPLVEGWAGVPADELSSAAIPPQADRGIANVLWHKLAEKASGRASSNGVTRTKAESPHVWQVYPNGGMVDLCQQLARGLEGQISLKKRVERIVVENGRARAVIVNGERIEASAIVSTAPIHVLPKLVEGADELRPLAAFRYRPMVLAVLKFRERPFLPATLVWTPERDLPFFKVIEVPRAVPFVAPADVTTLNVDMGCELDSDLYSMTDDEVGRYCVEHLERIFPGARRRFVDCRVIRTPIGYPLYLRKYEAQRLELERSGLPVQRLHTVGRNGEFAHILMEDVYWRTLDRMRGLRAGLQGEEWTARAG